MMCSSRMPLRRGVSGWRPRSNPSRQAPAHGRGSIRVRSGRGQLRLLCHRGREAVGRNQPGPQGVLRQPVLFRGFLALSFYLSVAVRIICHLSQRQTAHPICRPPSSHTNPKMGLGPWIVYRRNTGARLLRNLLLPRRRPRFWASSRRPRRSTQTELIPNPPKDGV